MLNCIIIDDEQHCVDGLKAMIETRFASTLKVLNTYTNPVEAHGIVLEKKPDIIFLDIEMPRINGIDFVKMFPSKNFEVIYTTAYDKYALEAIKNEALDYLIKPFSINELSEAIAKCIKRIETKAKPKIVAGRFAIHSNAGNMIVVEPQEIIRIKADSNYSIIFFADKPKLLVAKTLKDFEEQLVQYDFFRCHNSNLINILHVKSFQSSDGEDYIQMSNGDNVELSRRRKTAFFEIIKKL
ncbi:MAG: LytTR family DNA-binding domain-containing protein [Flavobacterium sp.]|nr:LytTR family DNA-binding domain-containing protein [Flavobacterium sp.]